MNTEVKNTQAASEIKAKEETQEYFATPLADVYTTKEGYHILLDMPGVSKNDIALKIDEDELRISGKISNRPQDYETVYNEICYDGYRRNFVLPHDVDVNKIEAKHENGVLKVFLHKRDEFKPKFIEIK